MKTKQIIKKQNKKQGLQKKNKHRFHKRNNANQENINENVNKQNMCTNSMRTTQFKKQEHKPSTSDNSATLFQDSQLEPYLPQIYAYMSFLDQKSVMSATRNAQAFPNSEINQQMRKKLLKWIVSLATTLKLKSETLHICVQLIDQVLRQEPNRINRNNFQLLGIASLFISSKIVQIFKIEVKVFTAACQGFYTSEDLFEMEMLVLLSTKFEVNKPSVHQFLSNFMKKQSEKTIFIMKALADLCIYEYSLLSFYPKHILAKSITYLSKNLTKEQINLPQIQCQSCFMKLYNLYKKSGLSSSLLGK